MINIEQLEVKSTRYYLTFTEINYLRIIILLIMLIQNKIMSIYCGNYANILQNKYDW